MDKRQAEAIYRLTSNPDWQVFLTLQNDGINALHKELEWQGDIQAIAKLQGAIQAMRVNISLAKTAYNVLDSA